MEWELGVVKRAKVKLGLRVLSDASENGHRKLGAENSVSRGKDSSWRASGVSDKEIRAGRNLLRCRSPNVFSVVPE
jgi:hypothetical protein